MKATAKVQKLSRKALIYQRLVRYCLPGAFLIMTVSYIIFCS
jgi:hypothetical protein